MIFNSYITTGRLALGLLAAACFGFITLAHVAAGEPDGYEKKETRQASYEAALQSAGLPVFGGWKQVAPFDPILRRPQPPDEQPGAAEYSLFGGGTASWRAMPEYLDGYANTVETAAIDKATLAREPTVYLKRTVTAREATRIPVYLGCNAGSIVWCNGKPVLYAGTLDKLEPGAESVELPLVRGENTVILKIALTKSPCRFFFMPELGAEFGDALLAKLHRDFPGDREPLEGYRERTASQSTTAEDRYYRLVEIATPPGVVVEGGGMDFLPDGRLAVSTRRGFVYLVENAGSDDPQKIRFHRFASGLHEALGMKVVDGQIVVVNKGELTRLRDTDGDDVADTFDSLSNAWGLSGNYHEYAFGLVEDAQGNLYVPLNISFPKGGPSSPVPYRGWVVRITPQGVMEPFCYGFRSPNGIGTNAEGDIFVTDNQGEWVPACPLYHIQQDRYYGHPVSGRWTDDLRENNAVPTSTDRLEIPHSPPAVWLPYEELSQSATDVVCDITGGKFGPFAEQLFVGEMTKGLVARVQLEKINGQYQGACFVFRRGCGAVNRMTFGPDGNLYLSRANRGWGGGGLGDGMARLEFTGEIPLEMQSVRLLGRGGFELTFTHPLADGSGENPADYNLEQFGYHYWAKYGSPKTGLRKIEVVDVAVSQDRRRVQLQTTALEAGKVCRLELQGLEDADGRSLLHNEAFYTINEFPEDDAVSSTP